MGATYLCFAAWSVAMEKRGMPMRAELQAPATRLHRASAAEVAWSRLVATVINPELEIVACFCGLGLLASIYFIQFVPDYGAIVASLE